MHRRRVCFILPSFDLGGAQRVALNLLDALDSDRFELSLIVFQGGGALADQVPAGVQVTVLGRRRLRGAIVQLGFALRRMRPHAVFSTLGYVNLTVLALRPMLPRGVRIIVRESNTPSVSLPSLSHARLLSAGYHLLYRSADIVICQSKRIKQELASDFGVPAARLVRLSNPINADSIRRAATPAVRIRGSGSRFVAVGALIKQKGFDRLLALFARAPSNAHLTIFGGGPQRSALAAEAEKLGLVGRVILAGVNTNPWPAMAGADALLLPSRWEGMPNVALEALACGTRVIGTPESGGLPEIADAAATDAVTIASMGAPFLHAMEAVRIDPVTSPRLSLLPDSFRSDNVATIFSALINNDYR